MKFVTYLENGTETVGVLAEGQIIRVNDILTLHGLPPVNSMLNLIERYGQSTEIQEAFRITDLTFLPHFDQSGLKLLAPIPYPKRNIFCLGKNYIEHANEIKETALPGSGVPKAPVYFSKTAMPATGKGEYIRFSRNVTNMVDYEAELAVVIGKTGKDISPEDAEQYIFGYTIINDVSARDLQIKHEQWFKGKNLDTFCPMGPCITDKSELPFPVELDIRCAVNGEIRQNSNTSKLIFNLPVIVSDLSKGMTLLPGDIISTGTPSGVGAGFNPHRFLEDGDLVECSIEGIGTLSNRVRIDD
ncbi:MAG TPA: fumarylacetoacetate hydrolase family protein [Anaerovoracaceae bacterium]|nr:fumarylacetoacetate hydrolase family protein [Anaerovoracaceae bacterium]